MEDWELELVLLMGEDLSEGTESFREILLARCLSVLNADVADDEGTELDDDTLDMLAAAGEAISPDPTAPASQDVFGDNKLR